MRLRLKNLKRIDKVQPFAIEKRKDLKFAKACQLKLRNRFQVLDEEGADAEGYWAEVEQAVTGATEAVIGRRRGFQCERWTQDNTWKLIDDRKKLTCQ